MSYKSKGSVLPLPNTFIETSHLILRGQQDVVLSVSIQKFQTSMFSALQQSINCEPDQLQNLTAADQTLALYRPRFKHWFSTDQDVKHWLSTDQEVNVWFSPDQ